LKGKENVDQNLNINNNLNNNNSSGTDPTDMLLDLDISPKIPSHTKNTKKSCKNENKNSFEQLIIDEDDREKDIEKVVLTDQKLDNMRLWLGSVVKYKTSIIDLDLTSNNLQRVFFIYILK
jgi:hypothetical protein